MPTFAENFVVVRSVYPRRSRVIVQAPRNEEERDYRDLLNEANLNFFHREYGIALQNYLDLRAAILQQGYPELPDVGGSGSTLRYDASNLDPRRFLAVSKKIFADTDPGDPVQVRGGANRRVMRGEFPVNQELTAFSGIGLDPGVARRRPVDARPVNTNRPAAATRRVGLMTSRGPTQIPLDSNFESAVISSVYEPRITATTLDLLDFHEQVETNFVTYLVHLFYFVLPISIGDNYLAMGRYEDAIKSYREVLVYPFLNANIEAAFVWMKLAKAQLEWGNSLYRGGRPDQAREKYEQIVRTGGTVPVNDSLYQHRSLQMMSTHVREAVKEIRREVHAEVNPRVSAMVIETHMRLTAINRGLNYLGLAPDQAPIFRFRYLQSVATYLADNAIQTERTFVSFRSGAENQTIERMQMESAVELNRAALAIEQRRVEELALEVEAAEQTRAYAELREEHARDTLAEWNDEGRDIASMNAALAWAGQATNDTEINYNGVRYDGEQHDYSGTIERFFDLFAEKKEQLSWEMQQNALERQRDEAEAETAIAQTREDQARVRAEIQALNVDLAQKRYDASLEVLEYAQSRTFTEDLWFQLANMLEDVSRFYLDAAIYAAFLMERAYALEYNRDLHRIRFSYDVAGAANLLGGDMLKADIASFTLDLLQQGRKKSPIRHVLSLREEFPAAFNTFTRTGVLKFRTDLEIFDRRYPGTYRRKIKRVEMFVEGLLPLEGAVGMLTNEGVTTEWSMSTTGWTRWARVSPVERMVLSSYQFRRDVMVFQPSEEMLELFENKSLQANWTLELPRSGNNIDYEAITDIKFAVYFDADYSEWLANHQRTYYGNAGGRSMLLSSRFHFPDEYFRFDTDRAVTFTIDRSRIAFNHVNPRMTAFTVRLYPRGGVMTTPLSGVPLTVRRLSDGSSVDVTTALNGTVLVQQETMAPFADWRLDTPVDAFEVRLGDGVDPRQIGDIHLFISYSFQYRADA